MTMSDFVQDLAALLQGRVSQAPDDLTEYGRDWTRVYAPAPSLICFPRSTEDVASVLRYANDHGLAVVPSGGRTGLSAGALAKNGEIVLSMRDMRAIGVVDTLGQTLTVQAGAVTEQVHNHTREHGLTWPVDFASKGSSHVGGNIATNAGGVKVIRYGLTRNWVLGLTVVLADGTILPLAGALEKNNTGLDWKHLFIGSEGILGVITEATLKLTPLPKSTSVLLLAVENLARVLEVFSRAKNGAFTLSAFEFFTDKCYARFRQHRNKALPIDAASSHYVLVEFENADYDQVVIWLESLLADELLVDGTLAQDAAQARALWEFREGISESLSATGFPHKNDIALPISALADFTAELEQRIAKEWPGFEVCIFGHIGDGNLHVNVMKPSEMALEEFLPHARAADLAMFELVARHRGSISAEHGIGMLKKPYLSFSRAANEINLMRAMKKMLDPNNTLNPGKVLD